MRSKLYFIYGRTSMRLYFSDSINMHLISFIVDVLFVLLSEFTIAQGTPVYELNLVNLTHGAVSSDVELNITINQKGMLSLNSFLHKESYDYYMQVDITFDGGNGKFDLVLLNKTVNICKFLSTPSYETLLQVYYKELIKFENNFPAQCPIGGGTYYYLRNLDLNALFDNIPPVLPGSNCYINICFLIMENNQLKYLSGGKSFINFKKM